MVIEDGRIFGIIKQKQENEKCLVRIKYMHIIQNTGAIYY